ncbi:MAG TPA: hypothetical protein V6C57_18375, partial [Coleofasciculaceae cyanobacterium]
DGKITVNDAALGRHEGLAAIANIPVPCKDSTLQIPPCELKPVEVDGTIGVLSNGMGLTLATLDLLKKSQGHPASCVDLGEEHRYCSPSIPLKAYLEQGLDLILQNKAIKVVLVNLICGSVSCLQVAEILADYLQRHSSSSLPAFVLRLVGLQFHQAQEALLPLGLPVMDQLDEAIAQTVELTQPDWIFNLQNRLRPQPPEALPGSLSNAHSPVFKP